MSIPKSGITRQIMLLNRITNGAGALRLPPTAKALDVQFFQEPGETAGANQFWKENLPQLQFYNPGVAISVREFRSQDADKGRKSFVKLVLEDNNVKQFDVKEKSSSDIIESLINEFGAEELPAEEIKSIQLPKEHLF